jgi:hypothetical protein
MKHLRMNAQDAFWNRGVHLKGRLAAPSGAKMAALKAAIKD